MKKKWMKRVSISILSFVLLITVLIAVGDMTPLTAYANASYIKDISDVADFDIDDYLDKSLIYKLPESVNEDDYVSVIVYLDNPSILDAYDNTDKTMSLGEYSVTDDAENIRTAISERRADILDKLDELNIEYRSGVNYDTLFSGFEVVVQGKYYEALACSLGDGALAILSEEYKISETQLVENEVSFDEATGIFDTTGFGYDGSGMLVAVLDTGLDYTHSAFSTDPKYFNPSKYALTKEEVAEIMADNDMRAEGYYAGLSADDVYVNAKVPFSFDYADADADVYSLHNNHGTHVSGIIVGNDDVITGVAPNAQLVSMKIFSDIRESAYTSWILAALEDCVTLGVDVINMSLGTSCGFSHATEKELVSDVYARIQEQGISLVVAASNSFSSAYASEKNGNLPLTSNPDVGTVGSPSTYNGAFSVASIDGKKTPYILFGTQIIYFDEATDAATDQKDFVDEILGEGVTSKEFDFVIVPGAGREADYTGMDVKGKIVLVERGFNTFEEKANAAEKMGALGVIVYNNVSGEIRMNVGTTKLPACSINQDDGEVLAAAKSGKLTVGRAQTSGPFMSDFSSWGPTPDLGIKPEITAHGGNILSSVTGGGYDRLSGTSMACPNLAGAIVLMRQHVMEKYPDIADDPIEVNAYIDRLLMSTANIILNKNGLPYSVRKQGAGLAVLANAAKTPAYILTYNDDGSIMGTSKLELGDDPTKSGVYTLNFTVKNFESSTLSYKLSSVVMTEGVSETKTSHGETSVTQDGYLLSGASVQYSVSGGTLSDGVVTLTGNSTVNITATITLSADDKEYLNNSFKNGMYVEGFICLEAASGTDIDLSVPYLAFYGDWTQAPLFDLDYYATNADELDDSIDILDKTLADSYATRPVGGISEDYVSYLGSYYFIQDPASAKIISASRDYIAISNTEGSIHSLRFVWAGMLRNAERIEIQITDNATGEVVFEKTERDIRKSYGDGGTIRPSNIEIEFDAAEHDLKNNSEYTVRLTGYLDYGEDGGKNTNENNVFEFPLVVDFEAPAVTGCEFRYEYDKELKKNRLYATMAVYDNHYAMAMMLGYVKSITNSDGAVSYEMASFDRYLQPVYSVRDGVTYVEYELTDHVQELKNNSVHKNTFTVVCYDYALNEATYEITLPDEYIDFYFEDDDITLSPNELYSLTPLIYPDTEWGELLLYRSSNEDVAMVVNDKIIAINPGIATITAYEKNDDGTVGKSTKIRVNVLKEGDEGYQAFDPPVADEFSLIGYKTLKAYYILTSDERDLGETGDYRVLDRPSLAFYPSESVALDVRLDAYFPKRTTILFESANERIVTVDQNGIITAKAEGFASVNVTVLLDGEKTYYSQSIDIEVKDPFVTTAPALTHYYGMGGTVTIPDDLLITRIGDYAFANFNYVPKTEDDIISEDEPDATKMMYIGDNTITKVIIPEGVEKIGAYAFANLTALEEVVLPSTLESIEYGAFYGCTSLKKVTGINHVKLINKDAFNGCNITGTVSLDSARAIGDYAFAGNKNIKKFVLSETLQSIGEYAFYGNEKLESVTVNAEKVKYGPYVFSECKSLTEIKINTGVIPTGAFAGAEKLSKITIGPDVTYIGEYAFHDTAISSFTVDPANKAFKAAQSGTCILSADGKTLVLVAPRYEGAFAITDGSIKVIGHGAFSSNERITSVNIPSATIVENHAFANCIRLESVTLGSLTEIGDYAFFRTSITVIPSIDMLDSIGSYAFGYTKISSVEIPNGMKVGEGAFCECRELASVTIGDNAEIGLGAFMLSNSFPENYQLVRDPDFEEKVYSYKYLSALTSLTIGKNVTIGKSAFMGAAKLESVTIGAGAKLGEQSFYNASSLKNIDLSGVISIGKNAFSGDDLYVHGDSNGNTFVYEDGKAIRKQYAACFESVDLTSLEYLGEQAFLYCNSLKSIKLGANVTEIAERAFYQCHALKTINLSNVKYIGANAFVETALESADLSSALVIGEYAFLYCEELTNVIFNTSGTEICEGAFAYCALLEKPENLNKVVKIGPYAFAYTAIVNADLSSATHIEDHAFLKENVTDFTVKFGEALTYLGENPFAMCRLAPFSSKEIVEFNGNEYENVVYTYDISKNVHVIDGSLYFDVPNGLELITYAVANHDDIKLPVGLVRISAYAFAGSDIARVEMPYTLKSIGHKAFFGCNSLSTVVFTSYEAPKLEEQFDALYYESFDNLPATGSYDFTITDDDGNVSDIEKFGLEIVPYYMWNVSDGKYSNVYYGATFVDYIGKMNNVHLTMVSPSNGLYYDSFIYGQYFSTLYAGNVTADEVTRAAIEAIQKLVDITDAGESITLEHEDLVKAARKAYDKIATKEQQALVTNISALLSAESRIEALKDTNETEPPEGDGEVPPSAQESIDPIVLTVIIESLVIAVGIIGLTVFIILHSIKRKKSETNEPQDTDDHDIIEQ